MQNHSEDLFNNVNIKEDTRRLQVTCAVSIPAGNNFLNMKKHKTKISHKCVPPSVRSSVDPAPTFSAGSERLVLFMISSRR